MRSKVCRFQFVFSVMAALASLSLDAMAQEVVWTFNAPIGFVDSSPAIADIDGDGAMDVIVTTTAGSIITIDAEGRQIWMRGAQIPISISPTVVDIVEDARPEILVVNQAGQLFCLDGLTGDPIWKYNLPGKIGYGATAIVAKDIDHDDALEVIVGDDKSTVACLSNEGQVRWTYKGKHGLTFCPAVGNVTGDAMDEVLIGGAEIPLVCLSHDGKQLWQLGEKGKGSSPTLADLDGDGLQEILVGVGSQLTAVSGAGKVLWTYAMRSEIDGGICAADADGDGTIEIYAVDLAGHLACLSPQGKPRWTASVKMRARRSPSIGDIDGDGVVEILVGSYNAKIYVFSPDGKLETTLPLPAATNATPTIAALKTDGRPYVICPATAGVVTAFQWPEAKPNPTVLWPQYRYDATRTGALDPNRVQSAVVISDIDFGNAYVGANTFKIRLDNPKTEQLTIQLEVLVEGKKPVRRETTSSDETIELALAYTLAGRRTADLTLNCTVTAKGKTVAGRTTTLSVIPFRKELADLENALAQATEWATHLPAPRKIEGEIRFLEDKLPAFRKKAFVAGTLSDVERRKLRDELAGVLKQANTLNRITQTAAAARGANKGPVLLSSANPWAPFGGMKEIVEDRLRPAALTAEAFDGEIETAALNIFNLGSENFMVRVEVDPLTMTLDDKNKKTVPSRDVVSLHEAVEVATQTLDLSADAIPALNQANVMILPAWAARQLWLNVDTSKLTPGTWTSRVRLRTLQVESKEFSAPLQVTVWDAKLPERQALSLCHWGYVNGSILKDQPDAALMDQVSHDTNVFVSGFTPHAKFDDKGDLIGEIDYKTHDEYVRRYAPHGLLLFQYTGIVSGPGGPGSQAYRKAHHTVVRAWVKHLADMGVGYDGFAFYPVDEPGLRDGLVDIYLQYAKLVREADPKIQMYTDPVARITMDELKEMLPYVDIWCPNRSGFLLEVGKEKLDLMKSSGKTMWNYECVGNAKHQSPLGYYRGQAWLAWHHGLTGIGFWSYCTSQSDPWYRPKANLDYLLIYQGKGVVPSKRWEAIRDGIEDYAMLKALADASSSGAVAPDLARQAKAILGPQASVIGRFCGLDDDGTVPGKTGLPGVRRVTDRRWTQIQDVRRAIAATLAKLTVH